MRIRLRPGVAVAGIFMAKLTDTASLPVEFVKVPTWYTSPASSKMPLLFQSMNAIIALSKFPFVAPETCNVYGSFGTTFMETAVLSIKTDVASEFVITVPKKLTLVISSTTTYSLSIIEQYGVGKVCALKLRENSAAARVIFFIVFAFIKTIYEKYSTKEHDFVQFEIC